MHLRAAEIPKYLNRELDGQALAALDAQVSVCLPWTELLAQRAMEDTAWERRGPLGRLVRVKHSERAEAA
jgi:hypothetical protein